MKQALKLAAPRPLSDATHATHATQKAVDNRGEGVLEMIKARGSVPGCGGRKDEAAQARPRKERK